MKNNVCWCATETPGLWTGKRDIKAYLEGFMFYFLLLFIFYLFFKNKYLSLLLKEGFICSCLLKANFKTRLLPPSLHVLLTTFMPR